MFSSVAELDRHVKKSESHVSFQVILMSFQKVMNTGAENQFNNSFVLNNVASSSFICLDQTNYTHLAAYGYIFFFFFNWPKTVTDSDRNASLGALANAHLDPVFHRSLYQGNPYATKKNHCLWPITVNASFNLIVVSNTSMKALAGIKLPLTNPGGHCLEFRLEV